MNFIKVFLLICLTINLNASETLEYIEKLDIVEYEKNTSKKINNTNIVKIIKSKNHITFDIGIMADNYHSCQLEGRAKMENGLYRYREKLENGKECILTFHQKGDTLSFEDKNFACKFAFCGMRAGFDDHLFKLKK